jgi:signal transduction histidine kinase
LDAAPVAWQAGLVGVALASETAAPRTDLLSGRVRLAVALAALASAGGVYLVAVSDHTANKVPIAALTLATAWSFLVGGYVAWRRRPENRLGLYLIANGALWLLTLLEASNVAVLFTAGALTAVLAKAAFAQTLLAYPEGHLHSWLERVLVAAAWLDVTVLQFVALTITALPRNLLLIDSNPSVSASLHSYQRWIAVGASAAALVLLAARLRRATAPLRRALLPVLGVGLVTFALIAATAAANDAGALTAGVWLNYFQIVAFGCVPLGFLVGLLRGRLARVGVADLVVELGQAPEPGRLRDSLARALGDDSLDVAYWLPETASYVDVEGRPVELPDDDRQRSVTRIDRGDRRVAALVHDAALDEEPELVQAASTAAGMALENERLQAELRATVGELRASRARIVEAADGERRRLERNLHDGAQQRLLALSFGLGLAETADDTAALRAAVAEAKGELAVALEELRELARGIHPAILSERGLAAALESLAARSPVPARVAVRVGRLTERVEVAVYYLVSEALANAVKHAQAGTLSITVLRSDDLLVVEVADDGVGGATSGAGSGLRGLYDRVAVLDGKLFVSSPPGGGTRVRAELPCG